MIVAEHPHAVPRNGFFLKKGPLRQNLSHLSVIKFKKFDVSKICVQALYGYSEVSLIDFYLVSIPVPVPVSVPSGAAGMP